MTNRAIIVALACGVLAGGSSAQGATFLVAREHEHPRGNESGQADRERAERAGGTNGDRGLGIARDVAGNSYVTGTFTGTATFGPGEANETTLTSAGSNDIVIAKHDAGGTLVGQTWRRQQRRSGLRHRDGWRRQQLRHRELRGHGAVRPRRPQPDDAHHAAASSRHLRREVRCKRRAGVGQTRGRHQPRRRPEHRDRRRWQRLRHRTFPRHGDVRAR